MVTRPTHAWQQELRNWLSSRFLPKLISWPRSQSFGLHCEAIMGDSLQPSPQSEVFARLMPQCRLVFSLLEIAAWLNEDLKRSTYDRARDIFLQIVKAFPGSLGTGSWRFALGSPDGAYPPAETHHLYAYAFLILAGATVTRRLGDSRGINCANDALSFIQKHFRFEEHGGFAAELDAVGTVRTGPREQNPHMHLLEACIFAFEASNDLSYLRVGNEIVQLWHSHWSAEGVLSEYMDHTWMRDHVRSATWEPGHHFEWTWLILRWLGLIRAQPVAFENAVPPRALEQRVQQLLRRAIDLGLDRHGGVFDEISVSNNEPSATTKRIWPLLECLKSLSFAKQGGILDEKEQFELERTLVPVLLDSYLLPSGLWVERFDRRLGTPVRYDHPLSTSYHLVMAAREEPPR